MEHIMLKSLFVVNLPTPIASHSFSVPFFNRTCFSKFKRSASSNPGIINPSSKKIDDYDRHRKPNKKWASFLLRASNNSCEGCYLQNGGLGMALMSAATARVRMSPLLATLALNPTFVSWILAWFVAQSMKVILTLFVERKWDIRVMFSSGGMPSSHSALCTALTTSVAICHGVADSLFPVCLGFSLIVMYDAIGVRRHAGMQAEVLNVIVGDLFQGHPIGKRKLKELLGHTPSQVGVGAILGIVVAVVCCQGVFVPI